MTGDELPVRAFPFEPPPRLEVEPTFAELREREPISRVRLPYGGEAWLVTRYADVKAVFADPRFGRAATVRADVPRIQPEPASEGVLMSLDPPEHTRLRKTVTRAFTVRRVEGLRPGTEKIAADLLDSIETAGPPVDLVAAYAVPLSVAVICKLLGVPVADQPMFSRWSDALLSTTANTATEMVEAADAMADYFAELVARRRRQPTDDLLGEMVRVRDGDGDRMSERELVTLARDLLLAGHETTASQITNFTYVLLQHPAELARLRERPELMPSAVEEMMRYVSLGSGGFRCRVAAENVELNGVSIRAGEAVFAPTIAANWDETVFQQPDRLDIERGHNPHVGFGHGQHHCLGAQLARMEINVALTALLRRFTGLRLAVPEAQLRWKRGMQIRGPRSLPLSW